MLLFEWAARKRVDDLGPAWDMNPHHAVRTEHWLALGM